eukprot:gene831-469_t
MKRKEAETLVRSDYRLPKIVTLVYVEEMVTPVLLLRYCFYFMCAKLKSPLIFFYHLSLFFFFLVAFSGPFQLSSPFLPTTSLTFFFSFLLASYCVTLGEKVVGRHITKYPTFLPSLEYSSPMWPFTFTHKKKKWPSFSAEEVEQHHTPSSIWIISDDSVYDITDILLHHPGGEKALTQWGGGKKDCKVDQFFHSACARNLWKEHKIGEITPEEKSKLLNRHQTLLQTRTSPARSAGEHADTERRAGDAGSDSDKESISLEKIFLNSPDWIVYNRSSEKCVRLPSSSPLSLPVAVLFSFLHGIFNFLFYLFILSFSIFYLFFIFSFFYNDTHFFHFPACETKWIGTLLLLMDKQQPLRTTYTLIEKQKEQRHLIIEPWVLTTTTNLERKGYSHFSFCFSFTFLFFRHRKTNKQTNKKPKTNKQTNKNQKQTNKKNREKERQKKERETTAGQKIKTSVFCKEAPIVEQGESLSCLASPYIPYHTCLRVIGMRDVFYIYLAPKVNYVQLIHQQPSLKKPQQHNNTRDTEKQTDKKKQETNKQTKKTRVEGLYSPVT